MARLSTKTPEEFKKGKKIKLEQALELYKKGKITHMKAAGLTGISLWEIMEIIREKRIPMYYTIDDVQKDIKSV